MKSRPIKYKYDLMHNNTPSYASSVITWDCSKMGKITFNRVVKWLDTGTAKYNYGEAAGMYNEVRKRFDLPSFVVRNGQGNPNNRGTGVISWERATPQLLEAIDRVRQTELVIHRMENSSYTPWYLQQELDGDEGRLYLENVHDLTEVEKCVAEIIESDKTKEKRKQAVEFVKSGGKLEFTWGT
ncbi:hypothetical protein UFOVP285_65 [uncultured Caudovirales phage]|uniref:Uncharacterized protein n=1 Tax=uncultured Caudovirales phage TaxID=2100421 RepID=A0A6J5LRJ3_9CAUD|nr:hypothetical protein UFOVP285_65 [uncultured Caudovirales phage]